MKLFCHVLQATGYPTIEATTGEDAVDLATAHAPALVLMDTQLPGGSRTHMSTAPRTLAYAERPAGRVNRF